jgi:hypothetical protein
MYHSLHMQNPTDLLLHMTALLHLLSLLQLGLVNDPARVTGLDSARSSSVSGGLVPDAVIVYVRTSRV